MNSALLPLLLAGLVSPYAQHGTLDIRNVRLPSEQVACYERVELTVRLLGGGGHAGRHIEIGFAHFEVHHIDTTFRHLLRLLEDFHYNKQCHTF